MIRTSILMMSLMLASIAQAQQVMDKSGKQFDEGLASDIADALVNQTSDPYSAQFIRLHQSSGSEKIVCGYVNLRNQYGGYVGFAPFFYSTESKQVDMRESSGC